MPNSKIGGCHQHGLGIRPYRGPDYRTSDYRKRE